MIESKLKEQGGSFLSTTPQAPFAPEDFSADERLMIETADQFAKKEILPLAERIEKQEDGLMPSLIAKAGEMGFCGVDCPEEYGGLGLSKNLACRILEHLSLDASFSVTIGVTSGIAQFGLVGFGTEEQKQKYLPHLATGEWMGAYALSEPNSGSDALSLQCKAEIKDGSYVLNGTKMWISNAKWAKLFLVMAKLEGSERISAFLVESSSPGLSIAREEHKLGLKGSSTARLILENAVVPQENLLYLPGKGHQVAFNSLNMGRLKLAAMSIGPARHAIGLASAYAQDRAQFGKSISEFGLIQQKFANMASQFFAAESAIYRTGHNVDEAFGLSDGSVDQNKAASEEFAVECSACKIFATEAEARIVDEALQCYGGYGFTEEFPMARIYRDARVSRIYEGTNEINRFFISSRLMKMHQSGKITITTSGDSFISELLGRAFQKYSDNQIVIGHLSDLALLNFVEQSARKRGERFGGIKQAAAERFTNWAQIQAAGIYSSLTGESVSIPAPHSDRTEELAAAIYQKNQPIGA